MGFRDASAVSELSDRTWSGEVRAGWDIAGNANGGYLMAIAARAMAEAAGRPDPVTLTAHFLSPGKPGPVTVDATTLREGKRFAAVRAVLSDADRPLLALLGSFADSTASSRDGPERVDAQPPSLPPPEECFEMPSSDTFPPPFMGQVELRLHPDDAAVFEGGARTGEPLVRGWFRFRPDEPIDGIGLLVAVDAFPPTVFNADLPMAWTPTLELTAHVRARPVPGWLRCAFTTHFITGGFLEEDGVVWDESGRLVAQSRQLALVPRGVPG